MRRVIGLLAALLAAGTLTSCSNVYRNTFKLTIEVEVDGERKIASSVYEREINDNLGGVADRIRGTMPYMSLGRHGDIVVSMHGHGGRYRSEIWRTRPLYVSEKVTWYYPPFDRGQPRAKAVIYPARGRAEIPPAGGLLSLPVYWRPQGVNEADGLQSIWFDELATSIDETVRPVRITIEPTREALLYQIPDAPDWIKIWRRPNKRVIYPIESKRGS